MNGPFDEDLAEEVVEESGELLLKDGAVIEFRMLCIVSVSHCGGRRESSIERHFRRSAVT